MAKKTAQESITIMMGTSMMANGSIAKGVA